MENKKSKYEGVVWYIRDNTWRATFTKYLGTFENELEAHRTYMSYKNRARLLDVKKEDSLGFDIEVIKDIVEEMTGLDISVKNRARNYAYARQLYCKIARDENTKIVSTSKIGKLINRDHSTVLHSVKKANDLLEQDKGMMNLYLKIMEVINRYRKDDSLYPKTSIEAVENIEELYENKLGFLKNDYKKKIDSLQLKNKRLEPILELLEQLPIDQIHNFQETRLKPFIKMFEAVKKRPMRRVSQY